MKHICSTYLWCRLLVLNFGIPFRKQFFKMHDPKLCSFVPTMHCQAILSYTFHQESPECYSATELPKATSWFRVDVLFLSSLLCFVGGQTLLPHPRTTTGCCCTADLRAGYVSRPALAHASNFKLEKTQVNHSAPIAVLFNISSIKVCSKIIFRFVVKGINTPPPPLL